MIADPDVMRDVGISHHQIVVADLGNQSATFGAAMNCHEFTDLVAISDACLGRLTLVLQILGRDADR